MNDFFQLTNRLIEDRYAIGDVVAEGGFGVVYRATQTRLGDPVAFKVLKVPSTFSEDVRRAFVEQFRSEALIISQLKHPAIVGVRDYGVIAFPDGSQAPWMALEWIDGPTLAQDLSARRGRGGRSPRECFELFRPVLEALALAHVRGVAHRDLKPGNLMLQAPDPVQASAIGRASRSAMPRMRVLDFGIAKELASDERPGSGHTHTRSAMPAYSPRYASPEQIGQLRTGPWTDVHALGLILTEMLVDGAPYTTTDPMELQLQVMSAQRPTPARFGVDVGPWEPVLAKALALRPNERFANADELLAALEAQVPEVGSGKHHEIALTTTVPVAGLAPGEQPDLPINRTAAPQRPVPMENMPRATRRLPVGLIVAIVGGGLALGLVVLLAFSKMNGPSSTEGHGIAQAPTVTPVVSPPVVVPPPEPTQATAAPTPSPAPPTAQPETPTPAATQVRQTLESPHERRQREREAARQQNTNATAPTMPVAPSPPTPAPPPPPPPPPSGGGDNSASPMARVQQCRATSHNEPERNNCIINALRGRASSDQELRMLAVTYQAAGRTSDALRTMREYVQRYPQGAMVGTFQQYIVRNGGN